MKRVLLFFTVIFLAIQVGQNPTWAGEGDWSLHKPADFNGDCFIDIIDDQMICYRYGAAFGNFLYDPRFDLEPYMRTGKLDYDIDIKDLQKVFGRNGFSCLMFWDPETSMGMYSYQDSTPTGPGTACYPTAKIPPGSAYYVDPVTVVFYQDATQLHLEQWAQGHGFPVLEYDGEQRFWEVGQCSLEDVDAGENEGGCNPSGDPVWCPVIDVWERMHVRAELAGQEWWTPVHHVTLGIFEVATAHFDDDSNTCGHFVPQVYLYPERIYPGFSGSGFDAGREWVRIQYGGSYTFEYWGNRTAIHQRCGDNQYPRSNGWVDFIPIN
jgi:hypothetical protein